MMAGHGEFEVRRLCPHCEQKLAPRTFREHLRLYYDDSSRTWTKRRKIGSNTELDFESLQPDQSLMVHSSDEECHMEASCSSLVW